MAATIQGNPVRIPSDATLRTLEPKVLASTAAYYGVAEATVEALSAAREAAKAAAGTAPTTPAADPKPQAPTPTGPTAAPKPQAPAKGSAAAFVAAVQTAIAALVAARDAVAGADVAGKTAADRGLATVQAGEHLDRAAELMVGVMSGPGEPARVAEWSTPDAKTAVKPPHVVKFDRKQPKPPAAPPTNGNTQAAADAGVQATVKASAAKDNPAPKADPKPTAGGLAGYRELKARCKAAGLSTKGKTDELTARLAAHTAKVKPTATADKPNPAPKTEPKAGDGAERAALLAKLATLDTATLRTLVELAGK